MSGAGRTRIAVGGIHIECSTYSPLRTVESDFRVLRGAALTDSAVFAFLQEYPAEFLPTLHARAIPGGPLSRPAYDRLRCEFLDRLRACGELDGLYLAMHGAMFVEGMEDAEGDWIAAARAIVGPGCLIAASYDLHGNLSRRIIDQLDMFSTYRTAPHIDVEATMRRAVAMLMRSLLTGVRPGIVWVPIPVLLPGERTSTVDQPARRLYRMLPALDAVDAIWDASLQVGYVWADEPRATAAAVLTGTDRALLSGAARSLAQHYWDAREEFAFGCEAGSIEDCVRRACASATRPVMIADSGDNPTAGGVGDRAEMLRALLDAGARDVIIAGIADRSATAAAYAAGVGGRLTLQVGASLDPAASRPVEIQAAIIRLHETDAEIDREAVVAVAGITLVLAARRRPYHHLADFARLGLDPVNAAIVVVKSGYLSPDLARIANPNLMALSPGVVDQDVERLPRRRAEPQQFPFDRDFAFRPDPIASARFSNHG